ncbi:MAG: sterol desaturase/sphingolipid hydroxylase (fatty acid hydroxylase superfamily) [Arenicella sp.]|jgi:sterol desaturase/sphingolipid hydroxylase (fatty acid hydroxylase superfamily)
MNTESIAGDIAVVGPFTQMASQVGDALVDAIAPGPPSSFWWPLLALTLTISGVFWVYRKGRGAKGADGHERQMGFWQYLAPKEIYTHQSARVDIGLYLIDKASMPLWTLAFLGAVAPFIEANTLGGLRTIVGTSPAFEPSIFWRVMYGAVTILVTDLMFFLTHLMMHKTEIGWAIHKVHHSAQVLTPLTRSREHFIAAPIWALGPAIGLSFSGAIFAYLFDDNITRITIMNIGIFSLLYALNGNFRHYHVSFRYPRSLEYWLQSPGMHHTHHSYLEKHWDTNLGLVTSIWDRLFGTLYIAGRYEETPWGLQEEEQRQYTSLKDNLITPFKEIRRILKGPGRPKQPKKS